MPFSRQIPEDSPRGTTPAWPKTTAPAAPVPPPNNPIIGGPTPDPRLPQRPGRLPASPDPWDKVGGILNEMQDQRTPLSVDPRTGRPYNTGSPFYSGPGLPPVQGPQDYPGNNPEFYQDLTEEALSEDGYWGTELPAPPSWPDTTNQFGGGR